MAVIDLYGYEVEEILKQAITDHESIGMQQINVLAIPNKTIDTDGGPSDYEYYWNRAIGNRSQGKITMDIRGSINAGHTRIVKMKLTPLGIESSAVGRIEPGRYQVSFTGSYFSDVLSSLIMSVTVVVTDDDYHSIDVTAGQVDEIEVDEDFAYILVEFVLVYKDFGNPIPGGEPNPEDKVLYQKTFDLFPFIRRTNIGNPPFEPYKPDLQTQINELREMIETRGGYNETQVDSISDSVTEV